MKQKMRQTVNRFVKSCSFRKNSPQVAVQKMSRATKSEGPIREAGEWEGRGTVEKWRGGGRGWWED